MLNAFLVVLWAVVGLINLLDKQITKTNYALMWVVLMALLVKNAFM